MNNNNEMNKINFMLYWKNITKYGMRLYILYLLFIRLIIISIFNEKKDDIDNVDDDTSNMSTTTNNDIHFLLNNLFKLCRVMIDVSDDPEIMAIILQIFIENIVDIAVNSFKNQTLLTMLCEIHTNITQVNYDYKCTVLLCHPMILRNALIKSLEDHKSHLYILLENQLGGTTKILLKRSEQTQARKEHLTNPKQLKYHYYYYY